MRDMTMGYTGQRRSGVSGHYLLGNGYRGFNPVLKRFAGQDSLSPFGAGGEHGFAYCGGDPVNNSDPTGHLFGSLFLILVRVLEKRVIPTVVVDAKAAANAKIVETEIITMDKSLDSKVLHKTIRTSRSISLNRNNINRVLKIQSAIELMSDTLSEALSGTNENAATIFGYISLITSGIGIFGDYSLRTNDFIVKRKKYNISKGKLIRDRHFRILTEQHISDAIGLTSLGTGIAGEFTSDDKSAKFSDISLATDWGSYIFSERKRLLK